MKDATVHSFRISFLWFESSLDLLAGAGGAPGAAIGQRATFVGVFAQPDTLAPNLRFAPPWPHENGRSFWTWYLGEETEGRRRVSDVTGEQAWRGIVPLRAKPAATVRTAWKGDLVQELFAYPHGCGAVLTARVRGNFTLDEMVEHAMTIRRTACVQRSGVDQGWISVETLAGALLDLGRREIRGPQAAAGVQTNEPFTVFTVVRGEDVDPTVAPPNGGDVHRALHAVTSWPKYWKVVALPNLDQSAILPARAGPPSHVIYRGRRGRAVWFPAAFTDLTPNVRSLSCYHRNLVLASLQVESLAGLASETARALNRGDQLTGPQLDCGRLAGGILGRLYGAQPTTYRSWSPRCQMDDGPFVADIDRLRGRFKMGSLH